MKIHKWNSLINYFNSKVSNKIFTRAELMNYFKDVKRFSTLQTYMNTLKRAGYIEYIEPGVYRKLKKIPKISEYEMKRKIQCRIVFNRISTYPGAC